MIHYRKICIDSIEVKTCEFSVLLLQFEAPKKCWSELKIGYQYSWMVYYKGFAFQWLFDKTDWLGLHESTVLSAPRICRYTSASKHFQPRSCWQGLNTQYAYVCGLRTHSFPKLVWNRRIKSFRPGNPLFPVLWKLQGQPQYFAYGIYSIYELSKTQCVNIWDKYIYVNGLLISTESYEIN